MREARRAYLHAIRLVRAVGYEVDAELALRVLDRSVRLGTGFHVYKMEPGYTTIPHEHGNDEHFLVISGDVTDNDGTVYREGDLVLMKAGTQHCSHTENGCVIAVYIEPGEDAFKPV